MNKKKEYDRLRYLRLKEQRSLQHRQYYKENKKAVNDKQHIWYNSNKSKRLYIIAQYERSHPEYIAWKNLNRRCFNTSYKGYKNYGGRGITVLYKSFQEFFQDVGPRPKGVVRYTLDRINNDGHYSPGNCRWVPYSTNLKNRRPKWIQKAS